ncbi:unnamed protein product [Adineta steineri]|uniref:Uncharacterized protein n=1 Tax=Adineta steineri TaxID=433720 RepID=A0A815B3M0_9BILA|nr:unnamed protein product [Adineta steineri]CAF1242792.1 unnamed protein product [Adineta steineri]CAF1262539.1 unnamed protein product [Adineta steineri]
MLDLDNILYEKLVVLMIYLTFIIIQSSSDMEFLPTRIERDTYDEREKLVSTYKIISKSQCLLQMRSFDGYIHAKHITNLHDTKETIDGIFLFLPVAVNLFLIQHKESKRYLCGRNNQLFGLIKANERECLFEAKRSDVDFGYWDSYRLFYENSNQGYLSISYECHTRLRKKYSNDKYLNFLAFIRINTDITNSYQNQTYFKSLNHYNNYRQKFIKSYTYHMNRFKRTR